MSRALSKWDRRTIVELHLAGWPVGRIATVVGRHEATVYGVLRSEGLSGPSQADRVEDALWLLSWGGWPERVASRCGFRSVESMDSAIRRVTGVGRVAACAG